MFGLFLGDTDFSKIVLKKVKKLNKNYFIIDFSKNNKFAKEKNSHRINIGKFGEIINLIKEKKSKVISSTYFNPELNAKKGNFTKVKPSIDDNMSINQGIRFLNQSNTLDHVQALVVKDNKVIAKEGRQGTKKMLSKLKKNSGGILI